jgi:hypothetical protein
MNLFINETPNDGQIEPKFHVRNEFWYYSKPLLIQLEVIWILNNPDQNMKEAVHSRVHILKRHMAFRKAEKSLVCLNKILQFLQTCIIMFKNKSSIN